MIFRTQIPILKNYNPIDYNSKVVSLGSCFSENISKKLTFFKFENTVNPFGIIFNPVSLQKIISRSIHKNFFTIEDVFIHNELWSAYEVHSKLSLPSKKTYVDNLNKIVLQFNQELLQATHCIITLGTAWVYKDIKTNTIVANCHRKPNFNFEKNVLTSSEITNAITEIISLLKYINPTCNIIFTISPVRHSKDGFVENNVSKALLLTSLFQIISNQKNSSNIYYFPSYEILLDELRDYRFYDNDMLHPNQLAIDYIWEKFTQSSINPSCLETMKEVETIQRMLLHKPFSENTKNFEDFKKNISDKIFKINLKNPTITF